MTEERMKEIIENVIYIEKGERSNYIDISGDECETFISAIRGIITFMEFYKERYKWQIDENEKLLEQLKDFKKLITIDEKLENIYNKLNVIQIKLN